MRSAILMSLLVLAGCGTWSNADLEFLYALPQRNELKASLEESTTQKPLMVGDMSETYDKTKAGSDEFNAFVDSVLTGLDNIRQIPPTTRTDDSRVWGPWSDEKNKGFEAKVVINRMADKSYEWSIQYRPTGGEWFSLGGGTFKPTISLRKGRGTFFFDAKLAREKLGGGKTDDPDRADFKYSTDSNPVIVEIDIVKGSNISLGYAFNGYEDRSATLQYIVTDLANLDATRVSYTAGWNTKTAGRADFVILQGKWATATGIECWEEGHTVVYAKGYNDAGPFELGDKANCVFAEPQDLKTIE